MSASIAELNGTLEVVADIGIELGEGPIWDDRTNSLVFVDSFSGRIFRFDPETGSTSHIEVGPMIGAALVRESGGFVASSVDGVLAVDPNGGSELLVPVEQGRSSRMNDAKCDSRGRLIGGTLSMPFQRGGNALYRIDPDGTLHEIVPGVTISNGLGWSPDDSLLYYVDTSARGIDCFDYDIETGAVSNRRRFADVDRADGVADGLTVDAEGHVWLALYLGGKIRRYAPDGQLVAQITMPVSNITSCNFGGEDLTDLYITTAWHGLPDETIAAEPHAGALFRCRPGCKGQPSHRFAG